MAFKGACFMVTWTIFKNHLLEVGLTKHKICSKQMGEVTVESIKGRQ
jgi:hypothetical protein